MKVCISSYKDYSEKTYPIIVDSLLQSGVPKEDVYFCTGGYNEYSHRIDSNGINLIEAPHNSMDFTGIISVFDLNIKAEGWFLLHDTCSVEPYFYKYILDNTDYTYESMPILPYDSMNMGFYNSSLFHTHKDYIMGLKNTSQDLNSYKQFLIWNEDILFKKSSSSIYPNVHKTVEHNAINPYDTNTTRIKEFHTSIGIIKYKANWYQRPEYVLQL